MTQHNMHFILQEMHLFPLLEIDEEKCGTEMKKAGRRMLERGDKVEQKEMRGGSNGVKWREETDVGEKEEIRLCFQAVRASCPQSDA